MPTPDQLHLLRQARDKAAVLLANIERDQAELSQMPAKGMPDQWVQGPSVCGSVVDAARKILDNLERSLSGM